MCKSLQRRDPSLSLVTTQANCWAHSTLLVSAVNKYPEAPDVFKKHNMHVFLKGEQLSKVKVTLSSQKILL